MKLSDKAITELREILRNDIGQVVEELKEQDLQELGSFLLTVTANSLKVYARLKQ